MTRKDYVLIAEGIRAEVDTLNMERDGGLDRTYHLIGASLVARRLAQSLQDDNPRFDYDRFIKACGVE